MRILMTTDTVGGVWTYALELAGALKPQGVAVALATMGAPLRDDQRADAERLGLEVFESRYKLEWMQDPWEDVTNAGLWLQEVEQQVRPDVVHLNGYAHGALAWSAPVVMVAHSCVLSWWQCVKAHDAPAEWDRYRQAVATGLRQADLVLAPTAAMLAMTQRYYGPLASTGVIPNGRDPRRYAPGDKEPLILSAGRLWDEAKNLTALEAVAPDLPWPVYVAGEARHPEGGSATALHVNPLGQLPPDELAEWFGRAAIYCLPARYEPFGLSALEAALSGCALVLGDIPTLREIWGDRAVFVPPDDHRALSDTLNGLIADGDRRQRLAQQAYQRARTLTPQRMAQGYLAAYRQLLGQRPASSALIREASA